MRLRRIPIILAVLSLVLLAATAFLAYAWRAEIAAIDAPRPDTFARALVERGAALAALGNCNVCHTVPGGKVFAGGLAVPTPFGTIYSTNITPHAQTGIGRWSEAAFRRSMREGVDRAGRHLYPAFPYDHFTLVTDDDSKALYAYLMTREPVAATAPTSELPFPLNVRLLLAGWKLLFLRAGPYRPDPAQSESWNRGAYLVEGLTHCGACHTPRNLLGAEVKSRRFAGGEAEGWHAYALDRAAPAPVRWDREALAFYLGRGWHAAHGIAAGPMAPVTTNLATVAGEDVRAIATYVGSIAGEPTQEERRRGEALVASVRDSGAGATPAAAETQTAGSAATGPAESGGAAIYAAACANCHESGRPLPFGGLNLALSTAITAPDPQNVARIVLAGLPPAEGRPSPIMPGFAGVLDDRQLVDLLAFVRARFSVEPPWRDLENQVRQARRGERGVRPAAATQSMPAHANQREKPW
jgi:mono/diheme cytochrome c family protein